MAGRTHKPIKILFIDTPLYKDTLTTSIIDNRVSALAVALLLNEKPAITL